MKCSECGLDIETTAAVGGKCWFHAENAMHVELTDKETRND